MYLETEKLPPIDLYRLLTGSVVPRPIAWISTRSASGVNNIAPYSFFTVASCMPPVLAIVHVNPKSGQEKDTLRNLRETGECVVNTVSAADGDRMNGSCAPYPPETGEFDAVGIESADSRVVSVPGVASAAVRMEGRLRDVVTIADTPMGGQVMLIDVLAIHVQDELLVDGQIDPTRIELLAKLGGDHYSLSQSARSMARPTTAG